MVHEERMWVGMEVTDRGKEPRMGTEDKARNMGEDLKGKGETPRLAGMQPLYIARELFDMRYGSRAGQTAEPMKAVVAKLTDDDIIAISSYLGSLPPA